MPLWKHLRAVLLLPAMVTLLVPALLVSRYGVDTFELVRRAPAVRGILIACSTVCLIVGVAIMAVANRLFDRVGRGTLAPWDPPRQFVAVGIYRHVRNPMMCGVFAILLGESLAASSLALFLWFAAFLALNLVVIPLFEEPQLVRRFGEPYEEYCRHVPRWIPRLRAWTGPDTERGSS